MITARHLRCQIGTDDIVLDRLIGAVLHQRYMFMCRRVKNDLRVIRLENILKPALVSDRTDQYLEIQRGIFPLQLFLNAVCIILIDIKNNQFPNAVSGQLPADLASDRSAASGYQDGLPLNIVKDRIKIHFNRISFQKILDLYISQTGCDDLTVDQLINSRQDIDLTRCLLTHFHNFPNCLTFCRRNGDQDLLDLILFHRIRDLGYIADDRNTQQAFSPLRRFFVDHAADLSRRFLAQTCLLDHCRSGVSGAYHHQIHPAVCRGTEVFISHKPQKAVGETGRHRGGKQQDKIQQHITPEDRFSQNRHSDHLQNAGNRCCSCYFT